MTPTYSAIQLASLRLPVRLGWEAGERAADQVVSVDVTIRLPAPPAACHSDTLSDTVDYAALVSSLAAASREREFRLLERLSRALYDAARPHLPGDAQLLVTVRKDAPPPPPPALAGLAGGAAFTLGDWTP